MRSAYFVRSGSATRRNKKWWAGKDSNLRRPSGHLIYSQAPLATRVPALRLKFMKYSTRQYALPCAVDPKLADIGFDELRFRNSRQLAPISLNLILILSFIDIEKSPKTRLRRTANFSEKTKEQPDHLRIAVGEINRVMTLGTFSPVKHETGYPKPLLLRG